MGSPRPLLVALSLAALTPATAVAQPGAGTEAQRATGQQVYAKYCAQCHGENGDGLGVAAPYLLPAPRDFTSAKYQIRTTPTGALPTDADIRHVIEVGIPNTAMPAFPNLTAQQITGLVYHLKSFSSDFEDPGNYAPALSFPADPGFNPDNVEAARKVYADIGCAGCHGDSGRGDGLTAPTLRDDWGQFVRAADLTKPWTFNGGPTRADIFRSVSTGLNGTPMAGFDGALSVEQRWQLVDFITAISDGATEPGYATMVQAVEVDGEMDLSRGEELFANAEEARFPIVGQIIEPGRAFKPGVESVEVSAVYDGEEIAFMLRWHDFIADTAGSNAPDLEVPAVEEVIGITGDGEEEEGGGDPFADELTADPFADAEAAADPFADAEVADDPFADAVASDDPFAEEAAAPAPGAASASEFSDAVALQFPRELPTSVRKPYFLFGDAAKPVELWYADLAAADQATLWIGRGSSDVAPSDEPAPEISASFAEGQWTVIFKRRRQAAAGISFPPDTFVPFALSVWDGFHRERGSKRGLSLWFDVYVPPVEKPSPVGPMVKVAAAILGAELLIIGLVRRSESTAAKGTTE